MTTTARRAALAAVMKNLRSYTKPRWPKPGEKPHNTIELLSGAEFEGGDVVRDIGTYLSPMLEPAWPHKLPKRLLNAMKGLRAEPSLARLRVVEDAAHTALDEADAGRSPVLAQTISILEDLVDRPIVYAAALGCQRAAARCAVLCCRHWRGRPTGFSDPVTHGLMLSMLDYLHMADLHGNPIDVRGYIQESRHLQIWQADGDARRLVHLLSLVQEAVDTPEPGASAKDDLEDRAAILEDRAGIVRQAPPVTEVSPEEASASFNLDGQTYGEGDPPLAPGMIGVGDVSHVKKGGKGDSDPVKEAEAIIGKRLLLVPPPADLGAARAELLGEFPHAERIVDRLLRPKPHGTAWAIRRSSSGDRLAAARPGSPAVTARSWAFSRGCCPWRAWRTRCQSLARRAAGPRQISASSCGNSCARRPPPRRPMDLHLAAAPPRRGLGAHERPTLHPGSAPPRSSPRGSPRPRALAPRRPALRPARLRPRRARRR